MAIQKPRRRVRTLWWWSTLGATGLVVVLITLPPFVVPWMQYSVYQVFSTLCHQMPERSFAMAGIPLAVCHRCYGIYAGLFVGTLVFPLMPSGSDWFGTRARWLLLGSGSLMAADWGLHILGVWVNTPFSQTATGALFGLVAGFALTRALMQSSSTPAPALSVPAPP